MRWCAIVAVAFAVQGCGIQGPEICTLEGRFSVVVQVRDSPTGGQPGSTPTGTMTDGSFRETMSGGPWNGIYELMGGDERPGTYDVEIRAAGYRPWRVQGVKVKDDGCHVITAKLDARMVPSTAP